MAFAVVGNCCDIKAIAVLFSVPLRQNIVDITTGGLMKPRNRELLLSGDVMTVI